MGNSLLKPSGRTQLNSIRLRTEKIAPPVSPDSTPPAIESQRDDLSLIRQALSELGMSAKAFALTGGTHESQVAEAMKPNGRLNLAWSWLWNQDAAFWLVFWPLVAAAKGVSVPNRRLQLAQQAIEANHRLLLALMEEEPKR